MHLDAQPAKVGHMEIVDRWTGHHANALRLALRMTNEEFAEALGTATRTVAKWSKEPGAVPYTELQRALDTMLKRSSTDDQARFAAILGDGQPKARTGPDPSDDGGTSAMRLAHDSAISDALNWIDCTANTPAVDRDQGCSAACRW